MKAEKRITYINPRTGEYHEKNKFVDMQYDEDEGYLFWRRKSHIKTFLEIPLPNDFTWAEKGRVNELKHYMLKDNQLLVYRSNKYIKPLGIRELSRILEFNERHTKAFVKKMKLYGIIKEVKIDGAIYFAMNPLYALKAKRITLLMFLWFQEELKEVLPGWVIEKFLCQAIELKTEVEVIK